MQKINVALCSFGMSGWVFHAPFVDAYPGFNLYGVWERSEKKAAAAYRGIQSFNSLDEMLADDAVELVIVNTPTYTHFEFAKKALQHHKHVLVEKAFTTTVAEAEELVELAKENNCILGVFQNRRYDSDLKTVKKVLDEGLLGEIKEVEFHYDRFAIELSPKTHKETSNAGAGLLHDLGPHLIDQALYLFGMPHSVFGFIANTRPQSIVNDYIDMLLFYNGFNVRLKAGLIVKEPQPSFIVHGTNGSLLKPRADVQEDELKKGSKPGNAGWGKEDDKGKGLLNILKDGETIRTAMISEQGDYMELYNKWYDAIINNEPAPVTGQDGVNVMRIIQAVQESHNNKKVIAL
ncbi:MAG: Gfo/Idh/MocA family oxidoreductase [Rhizobacter sp.]|nr:Gfo/Idh/MocA family oxidoreductase [Ferruginibacter sp.]